jgi:acyl carrier protein
VLAQIADRGPPLAGIVHTAGVVEDGLIAQQTWPACARVLRPKVHGAWALHREARGLDFVAYFSSAASLLGPHGQASYAAGNAFLDALAHHARAQGIPAVAINWGPWQLGMAARLDPATARRTLGAGWDPLSAADGAAALDRLVGGDGAQVAVLPVTWSAQGGRARTAPLTRDLVAPADAAAPAHVPTVRERLAAASPAERDRLIEDHVRRVVERTLGWAGDARLGVKQRFTEIGMDSLMAIEIRNRLQADLEISLAATTLFNYPTLAALTELVFERLAPAAPSVDALDPVDALDAALGAAPADAPAPPGDRELSDAELIDLIARKYQSRA